MQAFWRSLPGLLLLAALGLGLAYLGTGFLPRPEPALLPPEALRAQGQTLADESPARAVLERNVLGLERPALTPPGSPPAPPDAATKPLAAPAPEGKADAGNRPAAIPAAPGKTPPAPAPPAQSGLSGGPAVQGQAARPPAPPAQQAPRPTPPAPAAPTPQTPAPKAP